jgi:hypothetical protein
MVRNLLQARKFSKRRRRRPGSKISGGRGWRKQRFTSSGRELPVTLRDVNGFPGRCTINERTIRLAAHTRPPHSPKIDLPPGRLKVTLEVASGAAQDREFEVAANATWGLLVGPSGVPLPMQLY